MPALLSVFDRNGKRIGMCDSRCYNSTSQTCHCVCGGQNHGVGLQQAAANTLKMNDYDHGAKDLETNVFQTDWRKNPKLSRYAHPTFWPEKPLPTNTPNS